MEQKRGEGKQRFWKWEGGKLGQGVGALKKGGLEPPYELCYQWLIDSNNVLMQLFLSISMNSTLII